MSDSPLVRAVGIERVFRTPDHSLRILAGVDLTLDEGETAALVGVSGSGKSTLIQILGGLDRPDAGQVFLAGEDLYALSQERRSTVCNRRIGFVYQFHRLMADFSALENVMMPLLIRRLKAGEARSRAEVMLEEVGLSGRRHHKPGQLSGGEQQRVAIARAMVGDPDLLLADEPTGNLDQGNAGAIFELLVAMNRRRHLTCLMVTHNPELARRLDRRFHLDGGALVEEV
ncbi:MAG: ABC transporter ATP-binding protein [Magnetococcales bacterium]|nr:ABC transporter ATP-binding protein [Magnetococcales bacterium]MBF0156635.1 ABC transporter ATP-binding protein [Magnetococcales bacterium]